jgi:amino acid adenylation domain-containing protein
MDTQNWGSSAVERRERIMATVRPRMAQLLNVDPAHLDSATSFLQLGADSLVLAEAAAMLAQTFQVNPPIASLFDELATLDALIPYIDQHMPHAAADTPPAPDAPPAPAAPLIAPVSTAQRQLWLLAQIDDDGLRAYNELVVVRMHAPLDRTAMRGALQTVVDRHEILRTTFSDDGDHQLIAPHMELDVPFVDFSRLDAAEQDERVLRWLIDERTTRFDLANGPLIRVHILGCGARRSLLVIMAHHMIIDGYSFTVLLKEIDALYTARSRHAACQLAAPVQFKDYVALHARFRESGALEAHERYWRHALAGPLPGLDLPVDRPRPAQMRYKGACQSTVIAPELGAALSALGKQHSCTLFMTCMAVYTALLHRLTGQPELLVGVDVAGRTFAETENLLGCCTDFVPVVSRLARDTTVSEHLAAIRKTLLGAYSHQQYPLSLLLDTLSSAHDPSRHPLFSTTCTLQKPATDLHAFSVEFDLIARSITHSKLDLALHITEAHDLLRLDVVYNTDLFDDAMIARIIAHFLVLLKVMTQNLDERLLNLPILTEQQRQQLLMTWNNTNAHFPLHMCFYELFEAQVARTPDLIAAIDDHVALTYQTINMCANNVAHALVAAGVGPETVVAVLSRRGVELLIAMIAVFKAGGAYLPLDPYAPADRLGQTLAQSGTRLVLMTREFAPVLGQARAAIDAERAITCLPIASLIQPRQAETQPLIRCTPTQLAYVIYTSGSTGVPKGAMIEQCGLVNHLYAKVADLALTAADTIAQTASQCFDISVWQFLSPLLVGGRVHIFSDDDAFDPANLLARLGQRRISIVEIGPALLRPMLDVIKQHARPPLRHVRWLLATGESLPPDLCRRWISCYPNIPLLNAYGPTECSDDVSHYAIHWPPAAHVVHMPIGRPIANTQLYVLDREMQPVPVGVVGELHVGGAGVGRGYLNEPQKTAQVFVPDPFCGDRDAAGARLYKTGDLVRYLADGALELLGRIDQQIKVQGIRIEPAEIEAVLLQFPVLQQAVVSVCEQPSGGRRLIAYVVFREQHALLIDRLRRFLRAKLPKYMIPSDFVVLDAIPLNTNGKIDYQALPAPDRTRAVARDDIAPPTTPIEGSLMAIWADVLNYHSFGVDDDFFDLGGRSLEATQIASRARQLFHIDLPLSRFFEEATVAAMAKRIEQAGGTLMRRET